jgi:hypothetical protein
MSEKKTKNLKKNLKSKSDTSSKVKKKKNLRERMLEKKANLKKKNSGGFILKQKEEGTIRVRLLPVGDENDIASEITYFWLGDQGEILSPSTFGDPCPVQEEYERAKKSKDKGDVEIAKLLVPRTKYVIPILMYKDEKGKVVDTENSGKLLSIASGTYNDIIDLFLDEDEWGDMTDPENGYDIKITREGKGKNDTRYTVTACKNSPLPKEFKKKIIDLEEMVKSKLTSYEEASEKLAEFLGNMGDDDEDEDFKPKKKKSSDSSKSKKKRKKDI